MHFQPKHSNATRNWLCAIVLVLGALFFETRGTTVESFNCCISTNSEAIDAIVYIDRKKAGVISKEPQGGLGGGAYRCSLSPGRHLIVIKKPDFGEFSQTFEMRKEAYIEATLSKSSG